jgi:DNA processing protein
VTSTVLRSGDPTYPAALSPLGAPVLYLRGRLPALPGVAIVGTRQPSEEAVAFARTLAGALALEGIAIWSGGAVGIDAAAHEGALDGGGVTVLVAGGGLDRPYPAQHRGLFARVVDRGGALLARVPDGTPPMAPWFLARNEVLAALTIATIVVQAGLASGARSTAAAARRLGRTLLIVPHAPWDERGRGCAHELARGATAVTSARDVLEALGRPPPPPAKRPRGPTPSRSLTLALDRTTVSLDRGAGSPPALPSRLEPNPNEAAVLASLGSAALHVDEICERAGLGAHEVTPALLTLTLGAVVVEGPAGFFRRLPPAAAPPPTAAGRIRPPSSRNPQSTS